MKRTVSHIVLFILIISCMLSACSAIDTKKEQDTTDIIDFKLTGYTFQVPESFKNTIGQVKDGDKYIYADRGESKYGSGILESGMVYNCRTDAETEEFNNWIDNLSDEELISEETLEIIEEFYDSNLSIFYVFGLAEGKKIDEVSDIIYGKNIPFRDIVKIGSMGGFTYFVVTVDYEKYDDMYKDLPESMKSEFESLRKDVIMHPEYFTLKERDTGILFPEIGSIISFNTTDLDGKTVTSEKIFAENDLTIVNIWQTWCRPCINEFPELKAIQEECSEYGIGLITYCADASDAEFIVSAHDSIDEYDLYTLIWSESIESALPYKVSPTTYFIDRNGKVVSEPVEGAFADKYRDIIYNFLAVRS